MRSLTVAVVVATSMVLSGVAFAAPARVADSNDTKGRLDVRRAERTRGTKYPKFDVKTYETWTKRRIRDRGYFLIYLDTFGDAHFNYYALVSSDGKAMRASLYRNRKKKSDYRIKSLNSSHPNRRTARVVVPLKKLATRSTYFRWRVLTLWNGKGCTSVCFDRAPNKGAVRDPFPG